MTTLQQAIAERKHLRPDELIAVQTVYRETVYIPKDHPRNRGILMYKRNGTPRVVQVDRGHYRADILRPDNIYRPNMQPLPGDYLALANAQGDPTENHAEIFMTQATVTEGVYLVETMQGEMYTATRYPELDTNQRRAWKQVLL